MLRLHAYAEQALKECSIGFVVAPYEADPQLAYLAQNPAVLGEIYAVITEDSDLLAYGCPRVRFFVHPHSSQCSSKPTSALIQVMFKYDAKYSSKLCMGDEIRLADVFKNSIFKGLSPEQFLYVRTCSSCWSKHILMPYTTPLLTDASPWLLTRSASWLVATL